MKPLFVNKLMFFAMALVLSLSGCSRSEANAPSIGSATDLVGRKCAVVVGTMMADMTLSVQPGIGFEWFNDYNSCVEAVRLGKVDAMPSDLFYARRWQQRNPQEFAITEPYHSIPWGYFFAKGSPMRDRVGAVLAKMRASGDLDRILKRWSEADDPGQLSLEKLDYRSDFTGEAGVFRFATPGDREPVSFVSNDEIVGFDIDIARRIAYELNMKFELVQITMGALVAAVQNDKADMGGGGIAITAERAEKVDFSECYYRVPTVFIIQRRRAVDAGGDVVADATGSFLEELRQSFVRTFVTDGRWRMMARGLGVTMVITLLASVLGTLLAFPVWLARTSHFRWIVVCAKGYISIMQGTPILVLLMVLFYLVFGKVDIDGIWVAVLGFALNASAYVGETLRTGIDSISRGQTEAALALGYPPRRAFFRFVLPQAVRAVLPVYRGELIGLLKSTSIVGYIDINDLTKASDLVRSRTYESFFPIITTAFIYFLVAWLLAELLDWLGRRLEPSSVSPFAL